VRRDGDAVRLFTRRGYGWSTRYSAIPGTAAPLRARSFKINGEVVVCGLTATILRRVHLRPHHPNHAPETAAEPAVNRLVAGSNPARGANGFFSL
jgi:hypothetical protein